MIIDLADYIIGWIKLWIYKMIYIGRLQFYPYIKMSGEAKIRIYDKGKIKIGHDTVIRSGCILRVHENGILSIGHGSGLNNNCLLNVLSDISIGEYTIIGQNVKIYDHDHDYKKDGKIRYSGHKISPVRIGNNVWIGSGVVILRGSIVGDNSVIGAGTIVKGVIPPNSIVYQERKNLVIKRALHKT